jgi:hypothetical protein
VNGDNELLTGLSLEELEALAECRLAPAGQADLDELLRRQKEATSLSGDEERRLDRLLQQIDSLTILKTRARYTLHQQRMAATRT